MYKESFLTTSPQTMFLNPFVSLMDYLFETDVSAPPDDYYPSRSGIEIAHGLFLVPQAQMSECHQIITMDTILLVHIIFPNLQVW